MSRPADAILTSADAQWRHRYRATFSDVELYRWFLSVGLTPAKSLTLAGIDVPDAYLLPVVRGLLDGDRSSRK